MEECLNYFRQAVNSPGQVQPWSEWWAANEELVSQSFSMVDYVRVKHRKLRGAREILQIKGELPKDYAPASPLTTGSCSECGERTTERASETGGGEVSCPTCGVILVFDVRP